MGRIDKGKTRIDMSDIIGKQFGKLRVIDQAKHWHESTLGGDRLRHSYLCNCPSKSIFLS